MALFDRFKRKPSSAAPAEPLTADQLLQILFAALADPKRLKSLCTRHADQIAQHISAWQTVPVEIRGDPQRAAPYVERLIALAQFLNSEMGMPAMLQQFLGPPDENPFEVVQAGCRKATELARELRADEAANVLSDLLIEIRNLEFGGSHSPRGLLHGQLGSVLFHSGKPAEALPHFEQAMASCRAQHDADGIQTYHASLYEAHRYLGRPTDAADHAEALAQLYTTDGDAARARRQSRLAAIARAGEPLNRVVAVVGDDTFELDELANLTPSGEYRFIFARNRIPLADSERLVERGGAALGAGEDEQALAELREAARIDPYNPHPHYQAGLILLKLQRYTQAVEEYEQTEQLAPGWFHVRADLWLARQLVLDRFDHSLFLGTWYLTDAPAPPEDKIRLARNLLERYPDVPLLHLLHAESLAATEQVADAVTALRAGLAADPEPDVHTRLLVQLAQNTPDAAERRSLLDRAIELNGNLIATTTAMLLRQTSP
jgi:tetratricopeptide (TPR) repeat protein